MPLKRGGFILPCKNESLSYQVEKQILERKCAKVYGTAQFFAWEFPVPALPLTSWVTLPEDLSIFYT